MSNVYESIMAGFTEAVEAWEAGTNRPSGSSSRILSMMEMNADLTKEFPFVKETSE